MSEVKGDSVLNGVIASLKSKFNLSDAYIALLRKDLEDISDQSKDEQARTVKQVEDEIRSSVTALTSHHVLLVPLVSSCLCH